MLLLVIEIVTEYGIEIVQWPHKLKACCSDSLHAADGLLRI